MAKAKNEELTKAAKKDKEENITEDVNETEENENSPGEVKLKNPTKVLFLVNAKYNKTIISEGDTLTIEEDNAKFLEENEIVKIVK